MSVLSRTRTKRHRGNGDPPVGGDIAATTNVSPPAYFRWKNLVDPLLAAILLIPGLPVIGLLVLVVRLTSRGPGIYRQLRVGKHGRLFMMYKIRTMRCDAEKETGPVWPRADDPRTTRVGKVFRKLHLDELPQLLNVLKGDMYLVGPRPERPEFVKVLAKEIPGYVDRLTVRPGITGLAQINLPPDTDLHSVCCKLTLDVGYIRDAGFLLDARMFLCTAIRLVGLPGDAAMQLFRLRREVTEPLYQAQSGNGDQQGASFSTPADLVAASGNGNGQAQTDLEDFGDEEQVYVPPTATPHRKPR